MSELEITPASRCLTPIDRRIWIIAAPSILSNLSSALVGLVDAWAVGHQSSEAMLAGLAVGAFVMITVFMLFSFLAMSTVGLVAQAFGAKNEHGIVQVVLRSLAIAIMIGAIFVLLARPLGDLPRQFWSLSSHASQLAGEYLQVRSNGVMAILISMCVNAFLIGTQRARHVLALQLLFSCLNIALVVVFVRYYGLGLTGAAIGNTLAEWATAVVGLGVIVKRIGATGLRAGLRDPAIWKGESFRRQIAANGYLLTRTIVIQSVFFFLTAQGSRLGDQVAAANHLLLQLILVVSLCFAGLGSATQALIGAAKGAHDAENFAAVSWRTACWCLVIGVLFAVLYAVTGQRIIAALTDVQAIKNTTINYMLWLSIWPLVAVASYQLDAIFVGSTAAKSLMTSAVLAACVFVLASIVLVPRVGNTGLWVAFILFFAARGVTLWIAFPALKRSINGQS